MTYNELCDQILHIIAEGHITIDKYGEIVIYTNLQYKDGVDSGPDSELEQHTDFENV